MTAANPSLTISKTKRRYVVVLIILMSIIAYVDRQVIGILAESIKLDLGLTDTQVGLLTGLFFSGVFIVAGFPLARYADRGDRRFLASMCIFSWSVATALCGLAANYIQLALGRSLVALGEAGAAPTAASWIGDLFGPLERSRIFSFMSCGSAIGIAFGIYAGGVLNEYLGWRGVFFTLAIPGVVLAVIIRLTMPALPPPMQTDEKAPSFLQALKGFLAIRSYRALIFIAIFAALSAYAVLAWFPAFLIRVHGMSTAEIGLKMGTATVVGLLSGNLLCAYITHKMAQRDVRWLILTIGFGSTLCVPLGLAMLWFDNITYTFVAFTLFMMFMGFWSPPAWTIAVGLVPRHSRALMGSTIPLYQAIGGALGPWIVGAGNDYVFNDFGPEAIRYSLGVALFGSAIAAILSFANAARVREEYRMDDQVVAIAH